MSLSVKTAYFYRYDDVSLRCLIRLKDLHQALLTLQRESTNNEQSHTALQKKQHEGKKSLLKAEWMEETQYYEPQVWFDY